MQIFGLMIILAFLIRATANGHFGQYISLFSGGLHIPTATDSTLVPANGTSALGTALGALGGLGGALGAAGTAGQGTNAQSTVNSDIADTSFGNGPFGGDEAGLVAGMS